MGDYQGLIRVGIEGLGQIRQLNTALRTTAELVGNLKNAQLFTGQIAQGAQRNVERARERMRLAGYERERANRIVENVSMRREIGAGRIAPGGGTPTARRLANRNLRLAERETREAARNLRSEEQNRRLISAAERRYAAAAGQAAEAMEGLQASTERQQAQMNQVTRGIGRESRGNYLTNLFQGRQQEFARGGGGGQLSEGLQRQAQNVRAAWDIATAGGRENLELMSRLATEMAGLTRQQNEFNRRIGGRSAAFETGRRGQERIDQLSRMAGADPARVERLRSLAAGVIAAGNTGDIAGVRLATRRMSASIGRYERELNAAARELSEQGRAAIRGFNVRQSWQTALAEGAQTIEQNRRALPSREMLAERIAQTPGGVAPVRLDELQADRNKRLAKESERAAGSVGRFAAALGREEKRRAALGIGAPERVGAATGRSRAGAIPMPGQGGRPGMFDQYSFPAGPGNAYGAAEFQAIQRRQGAEASRPGLFRGGRRKALGEGLIGGAFPLLFGQGAGASVGGLAGGFAGGMIGGSFGFGLSLAGTAIGQAVDNTAKNLGNLASALKSPDQAMAALEASGFRVSDSLKFQVQQLQSVGRAYDAQTLVLQEAQKRLGPGSLTELNQLNAAEKQLQEQYAAIGAEIQVRLLPVLRGFVEFLGGAASDIGGFASQSRLQRLDPETFDRLRNQAIRDASGFAPNIAGVQFGYGGNKKAYEARLSELAKQELSKRFKNERATIPQTPQEKFAAEMAAVQESRRIADQIQSAYRESFNLQRQAHDLQYDGAKFNREVADYIYGKERQIFDMRQQAAEQQIENARAASQNRIERGDLSARQMFAAAVGFEQQLLSNVREVVRARKEGEVDIEQSRNRLELAMAKLNRDVEDYKRTNAREIEDIERRKLGYVRSVEDYKMRVADYVRDRSREAADLFKQAMTLPTVGAAPAGAAAAGTGAGAGMASPGGVIARTGATGVGTGPHLDVRWGDGRPITSADADRFIRVAGRLPSSFGVTSGYGPRRAPTAGASSFHRGIDFGTPSGTPVTLTGGARLVGSMTEAQSGGGGIVGIIDTPMGQMKLLHLEKILATPQARASTQISSIPAPTFKPTPIGPTPSAAPLNAANLAAAAQLAGGQGEAQRILEDQIKLRQKGIELGQIEQILQTSQLPQLQQQGEALKQQIDARQRILGLTDNAASMADIEAEASARVKQIELDRTNALDGARKEYGNDLSIAKQINTQADTALRIAKGEEAQRRTNLELSNQLQTADRVRSEILQLQEDSSRGKAEAAALERGELQASAVELLKASSFYQQMSDAQRERVAGLVAETEELRKQNDFRRSINEMRRDRSLVGAGLRAGFVGTGARAFEQGMKDFNGDAGRATQLAREAQLLESQQLVWQNLEKNIVDTSSAISGGLTNGLLDIVSGSRKIEDVGREMLNNIARSFADSAQQQLNALLQRQLGGMLGGAGGPLARMIGAGAEVAGPQALGAASLAASGQLAVFGAALQAVTAQMALSGAMGGAGSAFSGTASTLLGSAVPSLIPGFSPTYTFGGFFANGGVTRPGEAYVVGDGGEPEFFFPGTTGRVIPQSKLTKADSLRAQSRQDDTIEIDYTVTEQAGQRYVTEDQFRRGMDANTRRTRATTLAGLRNSKAERDYVNI